MKKSEGKEVEVKDVENKEKIIDKMMIFEDDFVKKIKKKLIKGKVDFSFAKDIFEVLDQRLLDSCTESCKGTWEFVQDKEHENVHSANLDYKLFSDDDNYLNDSKVIKYILEDDNDRSVLAKVKIEFIKKFNKKREKDIKEKIRVGNFLSSMKEIINEFDKIKENNNSKPSIHKNKASENKTPSC